MNDTTEITVERRLGGVARLYGVDGYESLQNAHVIVIGLGGVGSWAAEALARSAVGEITLIDFDHISISNTNRQLHALDGEFGKSKVEAMRQRLQLINPDVIVHMIDDFLKPENIETYIPSGSFVLDATDDLKTKVSLAVWCKYHHLPFVMAGAAGGKSDPTAIQIADLSLSTQDPLLSKIRALLRQKHGFEKNPKKKMKVSVVYSSEPRKGIANGGLACNGYGSGVTVTASFGMICASYIITKIIESKKTV
jgi:tRNA A37 threonylcarbamoyladenosine dehydratase